MMFTLWYFFDSIKDIEKCWLAYIAFQMMLIFMAYYIKHIENSRVCDIIIIMVYNKHNTEVLIGYTLNLYPYGYIFLYLLVVIYMLYGFTRPHAINKNKSIHLNLTQCTHSTLVVTSNPRPFCLRFIEYFQGQ